MGNKIEQQIIFKYKYIAQGSIVGKNATDELKIKTNRIFLDVGNYCELGVLDHHQMINGEVIKGVEYRSATKLVTIFNNYILDNIDIKDGTTEIEIVLHQDPDFDAYASAYLTEKLILSGKLPEGYEVFADYADLIDSGKLFISSKNINELCAVAYCISHIIEVKTSKSKDKEILIERKRERWFELFDYVFKWICKNKDREIRGKDIFGDDNEFKEELNFVKEDYYRYLSEKENRKLTEQIKIKLPKKNREDGRLDTVDGLIFNDKPTSTLCKYWARTDSQAPLEKGFTFTFIPKEINGSIKFTTEEISEDIKKLNINKAIISVDPNSEYSLFGLGQILEMEEVKKEEQIFKENTECLRDRSSRRPGYYESWCNNSDPWYDGMNFEYTIVDSPRRGSLLTIEEIKNITLNFTTPKILDSRSTLIIPFTFKLTKYKQLNADLQNIFDYYDNKLTIEGQEYLEEYFQEYINKYLYKDNNIKNNGRNVSKTILLNLENVPIGRTNNKIDINNTEEKLGNLVLGRVTIFKYGIGLISIDIKSSPNIKNVSELLKANSIIVKNHKDILNHILKQNEDMIFDKPFIYTDINLINQKMNKYQKKELVYKLCNLKEWEEPFYETIYIEKILDKLFMDIDNSTMYGFSKRGGALLKVETNLENDILTNKAKNFNKISSVSFEIYLFALQQRLTLMNFSDILYDLDNKGKASDIKILRGRIVNFVTQGWFTQIANDELGQVLYKRWQKVLECGELYREVLEQIEVVDEYNHASLARVFEIISMIVFPLLFIMQIVGAGIINVKKIGPSSGISSFWIFISSLALMIIFWFFLKFTRRKR